mmetsp:Transcript_22283/g.56756  ORF Transcript_22283/g.56756 Transcript_22283/m.56756 type:complete len:148 (-) Transcript_22283:630-1073(-)|eukprot:CAMPEP_0195155850 /NCGR_PEP_ID=MMETSP0448-20130528/184368_1 /TAXON_ID=66468 /ORGANISM="Heterocapsa triquestra, Strain CCMP 448" /LENGTH=147 /DNA_ID=CAMNT_0040194639 /DNA_START=56 /DNA_END=499 /DNA_ORIENTATION=+
MVAFCCNPVAMEQAQKDGGCPWCGGMGVDMMSGDVCQGCADPAEGTPSRRQSSRRQRRAEGGTKSLLAFVSEASEVKNRRKRVAAIATLECSAMEAISTPKASKVKFDLEAVLEFPVTPYAEKYGGLPNYLLDHDSDDGESSEEDAA